MHVHVPHSSGFDVAVADAVSAHTCLSAYTTNSAHDIPPEILTGQLYTEIEMIAIDFSINFWIYLLFFM